MPYSYTTPYKSNARHGSPGVLLATATRDRLASQMTTSTVLGPTIFCLDASAKVMVPQRIGGRVTTL